MTPQACFHSRLVEIGIRSHRERAQNAHILAKAKEWLGVPFQYGQASRDGCNCMGLIVGVLRETGLRDLSHLLAGTPRILPQGHLRSLFETYCRDVTIEKRLPGDFLLFTVGGVEQHVGIDSGEGRMIHTNMSLEKVVEQSLSGWEKRLSAVYRFEATL